MFHQGNLYVVGSPGRTLKAYFCELEKLHILSPGKHVSGRMSLGVNQVWFGYLLGVKVH